MSFFDRFRKPGEPELLTLPTVLAEVDAQHLDVYLAETLVIINIDENTASTLLNAAQNLTATRFTGNSGRPLTVVPINDPTSRPTLHPDHGWLLPLSPPVVAEIVEYGLGKGEKELESINIAFIVDAL
ncbi:hypothetical protein CDES_10625 [Corynebacterium deserti GIMN1.010]|uniref:Uncharacterized protein n=1 Tax=Corynebacterium deserti GIMN1.010 TaxID=931089 RepID=A0A0M4CYI1_9CORY|nr:hypothetical protein [Corynebacterium deserti]ALC06500.1 hypothetical protein CDES_10625 [Corynebacterium deserti GIMN1.010]